MKISFTGLFATIPAVLLSAALAGCTQGTPGGPGTVAAKPTIGQADDTFNLSVPLLSSSVQQGEKAEAVVGLKRAKNFAQDVSLSFAEVPKGVTIEPAKPVIKQSETDAKIVFVADDTAPLGDYKVKVTGRPEKGTDAQVEFKISITAKDTFTLGMPGTAALKQGESHTVTIGIARDKTFDQDVALQFGEMPKGLTFTPASPVIKHGETESLVTLTAAKDAALGSFAVKLVGHPAKGADAVGVLKVVVAKE